MSIVPTVPFTDLHVPVAEIAERAAEVDRTARFPTESIEALRAAGLLGLGVAERFGGPGGGPSAVAAAIERVSGACGSTGMVYTMHVVATQTLQACAVDESGPLADTMRAIGAAEHLTTIAFSETGTRSHFWAQLSTATVRGDFATIDADKSWVTSADHADTYVTAVRAPGASDPLVTELYLVEKGTPGIDVQGRFDGLGMRGNGSSPVRFAGVEVALDRRLGDPAGGFGVMMSATLPWFALGCAACCVGLSGAALEIAAAHAAATRLEHEGSSLADLPTIRARLGNAKVRHMQARALLYEVAGQIAAGSPDAQVGVLALKAAAAEMAVEVTDAAMRVCGGAAYSRHLPLERLFRDARAASVMAPTTDLLVDFLGKAVTGRPLF
jgi:alkylation response protein AidB-like acyl-CoA dehydrogenase